MARRPERGSGKQNRTVALLTGCQDRPYAHGLATALANAGVSVDLVGSEELDSPELHRMPALRFLNVRPRRDGLGRAARAGNLLNYYKELVRYTSRARPAIIHILWNNKFEHLDRTLLMRYYRSRGSRVALTAHNVNQARRDGRDSWLNRVTLRAQYHLADHIFVHTPKMKAELCDEFQVNPSAVTVLRYPLDNAFPDTGLVPLEAKRRLGVDASEKCLLFFGRITPYKGLEYLLDAFETLVASDPRYRLIIAGSPKKGDEKYVRDVRQRLRSSQRAGAALLHDRFIPDHEIEVYFKAADVLVLPYTEIFQSGVLFLGYTFGLPVVAADVGSFAEDVVEGSTGFLCRARDPLDLGAAIDRYFASDLFRDLAHRRTEIRDHFRRCHSWSAVAAATTQAYDRMSRSV